MPDRGETTLRGHRESSESTHQIDIERTSRKKAGDNRLSEVRTKPARINDDRRLRTSEIIGIDDVPVTTGSITSDVGVIALDLKMRGNGS